MKKTLLILLALVLAFAFTACGETTEPAADQTYTTIPLGGNLQDLELSGEAFGEYVIIDFPEGMEPETGEATLYYSEDSDTPYIAVYRWAKEEGQTLEDIIASQAEQYGCGNYVMTEWPMIGAEAVGQYICGAETKDGGYMYFECNIMEDGDDFVEVDFGAATEEVQLGESEKYLWIPKGYTDQIDEEEAAHGTIFYGTYDESYQIPMIWINKYDPSYEKLEWEWSEVYPDGLPFDEAAYKKWSDIYNAGEWTDEVNEEYYSAFGLTDIAITKFEADGQEIYATSGTFDKYRLFDTYINVGDDWYTFYIEKDINMSQRYGRVIVESLHSK